MTGEPMSAALAALAKGCVARGWSLATAESCTGGLLAERLTAQAGSSRWYYGTVVSYANAAKVALLGVPASTLHAHGAVSEAVALAMVEGLLKRTGVELGVAITGVAGPEGGSPSKPVGTVWIAWARPECEPVAKRFQFAGDRDTIRQLAAAAALDGLCQSVAESGSVVGTVAY